MGVLKNFGSPKPSGSFAVELVDNMSSNGQPIGDGSWILKIYITDLQIERQLRVKSDVHIGGVMLRLVDDLGQ